MKAARSAEMLVSTNKITWYHNPQHHNLNQQCANLVCQVARVPKFNMAAPNILSISQQIFFFLPYKNVYRYTCTEQKGRDSSHVQGHWIIVGYKYGAFHVPPV